MGDLPNGMGAREHGKFIANKHDEIGVRSMEMGEASVITLRVTASGDTQIIPSPGSTKYITIRGFHFSNNDSSKVTVSLKAGSGGEAKFSTVLAASGGSFDKNLIGRHWEMPINKALYVTLSGASDVYVTIEYEGYDEPAEESVELTDTITFSEALASDVKQSLSDAQTFTAAISKNAVVKGLSDTGAIAEALAGTVTLSLSDSLSISESEIESTQAGGLADSLDITESLALLTGLGVGDSQAITEGVGNGVTLSLNDSMEQTDSNLVVTHTPG